MSFSTYLAYASSLDVPSTFFQASLRMRNQGWLSAYTDVHRRSHAPRCVLEQKGNAKRDGRPEIRPRTTWPCLQSRADPDGTC